MKKFARVLAVALVVVTLCATLASCGKVSGAYVCDATAFGSGAKITYDFGAFGKVTATVELSLLGNTETKTLEGKYEVTETEDDKMEITFTYEEENDNVKSGTYSFEIDKENDTIKIAGITYKAVKD